MFGLMMANSMQEYHLLHVTDQEGERTYHLNVAAVSIGRDSSNGIVIADPRVSRHHAMLIRMPSQTHQYAYELIDGDLEGCLSQNGVYVNQVACQRRILFTGDRIRIGKSFMSYIIASMTPEEYQQYFDAHKIQFRSLKEGVQDPIGTVLSKIKMSTSI